MHRVGEKSAIFVTKMATFIRVRCGIAQKRAMA
jgi:hypothetical protein